MMFHGRKSAVKHRFPSPPGLERPPGLKRLPRVELRFRVEAVVGIVHYLIIGGMRIDLHGKSPDELNRLLLPVITGALTAPSMKKPRGKGTKRR
jgi:hypothetical protein